MLHYLDTFLDNMGKFGPVILFIISIFLLRKKPNFLAYYVFGLFLNGLLILVLKGIFKQPRPSEDLQLFNLAVKESKRFNFDNGYPYDIFGMPSGHSSYVLFSTIFIYLVFKNPNILLIYLLLSINTLRQRVISNNHTIIQVIAGAFVGILFSYFIFYMAQEKIMGKLLLKKDDNGPM